MSFPDEIIERIFYFCDGHTLIQCARSCKRFYLIAANLSRTHNFWFKCVNQEIEPDIIKDICGRKSIKCIKQFAETNMNNGSSFGPWAQFVNSDVEFNGKQEQVGFNETLWSDDDNDDDLSSNNNNEPDNQGCSDLLADDGKLIWPARTDPWFNIYVRWCFGSTFNKHPLVRQNVNGFFHNPVNCLKISGDLIILGHNNGAVSICDFQSNKIELAFNHGRVVTDIALVNLTNKSSFRYNKNAFSHHHHIISISKDNSVYVYPMLPMHHIQDQAKIGFKPTSTELDFVRIFDNLCAIYAKNTQISLWKLTLPEGGIDDLYNIDQPLGFRQLQVILGKEELHGWINLWEDKIVTICGITIRFNFFDLKIDCWTHQNTPQLPKSYINPQPMTKSSSEDLKAVHAGDCVKISRAFLFRDRIVFLRSSLGVIFYSLDHKNLSIFPVHKKFGAKVTTMALWGSTVAFGLANGLLIVYNILKTQDIETLDYAQPKFEKHVAPERGDESVTYIDIGDNGQGLVIIAATRCSVTIFKWSRRS